VNTKGAYQRKVAELKKKIKQTNNDANDCNNDIRSLQESQKEVSTNLEEKQGKVYQLQTAVDEADLNIDRLADERQRVSISHEKNINENNCAVLFGKLLFVLEPC
jgi:chromosome segregation ATPase